MSSLLPVLAALALAPLALRFLPLPFAWILLAWALVCAWLALHARRPRVRGALVSATVVAAVLGAAEIALHEPPNIVRPCGHEGLVLRPGQEVFDEVLGYAPAAAQPIPSRLELDGELVYEVTYGVGEDGLRASPPSTADEALLFFGGSFTFGEGMADDETLPWQVGQRVTDRYRVYNFGYRGYGPHQMLAALESGRVDEVVAVRPAFAVYQLILNHVRRTLGKMKWDQHGPRYALREDGGVEATGRFCDPESPRPLWRRLLKRSAVYRRATDFTRQSDIDLFVAVAAAARRTFEERYPGASFHVLMWDEENDKSRRILAGLRESGVRVHLLSDCLPDYPEERVRYFLHPRDPHPSARTNEQLADWVVREILDGAGRDPGH